METLNFNENCILGTSELIPWNKSLRQDFSKMLVGMGSNPIGIMANNNINTLKVSYDSQIGGYTTIQLAVAGSIVGNQYNTEPILSGITLNGVTTGESFIYSQEIKHFFQIPGIGTIPNGTVKYVDLIPTLTVFEKGTCNIYATGQISFSDPDVVKKLRGQNSNSPTKIVLFTDNSTKFRGGEIFEVMDILSSTSAVITGEFSTTYSDLYFAIVGSFDIQCQHSLSDKYLYSYIRPILTIQSEADPLYGGVRLAKLTFATDQSFTIEDIRYLYKYSLLSETWTNISAAIATSTLFFTWIDNAHPYSFLARSIGKGKLEVQGKFYPKIACVNNSFVLDTSNAGLNRVVSPYSSISRICDVFNAIDLENLLDLTTVAGTGNYVRVNNNIRTDNALTLVFKFGANVTFGEPYYFSVETNSMEVL